MELIQWVIERRAWPKWRVCLVSLPILSPPVAAFTIFSYSNDCFRISRIELWKQWEVRFEWMIVDSTTMTNVSHHSSLSTIFNRESTVAPSPYYYYNRSDGSDKKQENGTSFEWIFPTKTPTLELTLGGSGSDERFDLEECSQPALEWFEVAVIDCGRDFQGCA
jgi:hypothetical protein